MKKRSRLVKRVLSHTGRGIVWLLYLVFLLFYIGAMLAPVVPPTTTQIPAFLNLAFGVLLLAALVFLVFLALYRQWFLLGVHLLLLLFSWGYIRSYCPFNIGSPLTDVRDLRVMTYNVMEFREQDSLNKMPMVADMIRRYSPDLVCLQEGRLSENEGENRRKIRKLFNAEYPYIHSIAQNGLTVLSRYPIIHDESISYDSYRNGSHIYIIRISDDLELLLVNNHMESYSLGGGEKKRFKDYIQTPSIQNLPTQFMEVKRRLGPMLNQRSGAARKVRLDTERVQNKYQTEATIVLGDLNDTPMSYTYKQLRSTRRDAFMDTGFGIGVSYNEPPLAFRIDHLFYDGKLRAVGSRVPDARAYSDHNPLIVDFVIQK